MNVGSVLQKGIQKLRNANIDAPAVDAGVILCYVLSKDKAFLFAHNDDPLTEREVRTFDELTHRRAEGEPVQYITGRQEFMSLEFLVNPSVLIPRADTEVLVETIIDHVGRQPNREARILDIGTGSGCIAVSLAYFLNGCRVTAVDVSEKALETAKVNARNNNVADRIEFVHSDLFSELEGKTAGFDVIVSNPPYIPTWEVKTLQIEVREHEPAGALDGGADGLNFYRKIIHDSVNFLKPDGMLAFEVGYNQAEAVSLLMSESFCHVKVVMDLARVGRVVLGYLKPDRAAF